MGNVTSAIPAFVGGVSQQSPAMRLLTQGELMNNCHATFADGLMQKPNTDLVKVLGAITGPTGYATHKIDRDVDEKYMVVFTSDATNPIKVFALDGTEQTVRYGYYDDDEVWQTDSNKKKYLSDGGITDARKQIKAVSIADYTIVVNTQKTCAADSATTAARDDVAFVQIKGRVKGTHRITYRWKEGGTPFSQISSVVITWNRGEYSHSTDSLIQWFIDNNPDYGALTLTVEDKVLKVVGKGSYDVRTMYCDTADPFGDSNMMAINECTVDGFNKLPAKMPNDVIIKVGGDKDENQDDYYMQYVFDTKTWYETLGWEMEYDLDADTMPHRLIRSSAGVFDFCPIKWEPRTVGDDNTNPMPSFIDYKINNAIFVKNRLWFLSDENSIGSKAGDYFNFFSSTVMDVLDDDPIDIAATGQQVTKMRSGVGFEKGIMMISDEEQFALTSGQQLMTPKSVSIDSTTAFTADPYSIPIKLGSDVYFASPKGSFVAIRDYTIMPDSLMQDAYDITSHVPQYIPKGDIMMAGCNSLDMLFVWSDTDPNTIYVHQFLFDGQKKVQTAWYKWLYEDDIYGMVVFGTVMYLLFYDATNGFTLHKINLEKVPYDSDQDIRYHMDVLQKLDNGSFDDPDTTFALDFDVGDGSGFTVVDGSTNAEITTGFTLANQVLTFADTDVSAETYFVGRDYTATFQFSEWYIRDQKGASLIAGDLSIRNLTLSFINTGYFRIETTAFNRDTATETVDETMSGIRIDESVIGEIKLLSGEETLLIMAASRRTVIQLISDSYLPMQIQTGAWQGTFVHKGQLM